MACAENLPGEIEIPDHPLVRQTIGDCLHEAMDIDAFEALLRRLESGAIRVVARDLTEPSPLALEALNARPYAYLDDAPLEERRTQAVMSRRWLDPKSFMLLVSASSTRKRLRVPRRSVARCPRPRTELHDALLWLCFAEGDEELRRNAAWPPMIAALEAAGRIVRVEDRGVFLWAAAERAALFRPEPVSDESLVEIVRGRLEGLGPVTASGMGDSLALPASRIGIALAALEAEGFAMRGRFSGTDAEEVVRTCRLLAHPSIATPLDVCALLEEIEACAGTRFSAVSVRVAKGAAGFADAGIRCAGGGADAARRL